MSGERRDNFPQIQSTKLNFTNSSTEYVKRDGRHSEHFSFLKKVFTLNVLALSWTVEIIFDKITTAKLL